MNHMIGVCQAPVSLAKAPAPMQWLARRCSSAMITRIACPRAGTSMPASFSTARQYPRLFDMLLR